MLGRFPLFEAHNDCADACVLVIEFEIKHLFPTNSPFACKHCELVRGVANYFILFYFILFYFILFYFI